MRCALRGAACLRCMPLFMPFPVRRKTRLGTELGRDDVQLDAFGAPLEVTRALVDAAAPAADEWSQARGVGLPAGSVVERHGACTWRRGRAQRKAAGGAGKTSIEISAPMRHGALLCWLNLRKSGIFLELLDRSRVL